jgi:hypothetical protein
MALIAWYKLDGNVNDSSGNGYNGTVSGATAVAGKIGQCYSFDGSDDYIDCGNVASLVAAGTISVWVKSNQLYPSSTTTQVFRSIIGKLKGGSSGEQDYWLDWYGDNTISRLRFGVSNGVTTDGALFVLNLDLRVWTHIVARFDGKKMAIFVNGVMANEKDQTLIPIALPDSLKIGKFFTTWDGLIDDVRIYDNALSSKEIYELPKAKILHYKFDDFQEPTVNYAADPYFTSPAGTGSSATWTSESGTVLNTYLGVSSVLKVAATSGGYKYKGATPKITIPAGTKFTASVWAYASPDSNGVLDLHIEGQTSGGNTGTNKSALKGQIVRLTNTAVSDGTTNIYVYPEGYNGTFSTGYQLYGNLQIEFKDHATPFVYDSRTGTVRDCSGYGNDATLTTSATPQWISDSKIGSGCYSFDGIDDTVLVNSALPKLDGKDCTISCLVKPELTSTYRFIFGKRRPDAFIDNNNSMFGFETEDQGGAKSANVYTTVQNKWYFVAVSIKQESSTGALDGLMKGYVYSDGVLVGTCSRSGVGTTTLGDSSSFCISKCGWWGGGNNSYYKGQIDDVRIYANVLSDDDILRLYQERASLDDKGNLYASIKEISNITYEVDNAIKSKTFANGLTSYTQSNCQVTLTDKGYRIYRPANLVYPDAGNTMWGGLKVQLFTIDPNILQKNHKYRVSFTVTGQSSNDPGGIYFTNQMGWGGGGLTSVSSSAGNTLGTGFQGTKEIYAVFNITDDIWKVCTTSYSGFVAGTMYNCYRDLAWGFNYANTGTLGTDIYITDFKVQDITNDQPGKITETGILKTNKINEVGPVNGLVGWWKLDGNAKDYSGNNNHGTVTGATVAAGKVGQCYSFDGTDDYIDTSNQMLGNNSPFTYSVWIKFSASQIGRTIMGRHSNAVGGAGMGIDDSSANKIKFHLNSYSAQRVNSTMTLNDNNWHYISGTWDGVNLKLYVDGNLDASSTPSTTLTFPSINTQIGRWGGGSSQYFNGLIDDVRIYNRALSPEEIARLYALGVGTQRMMFTEDGQVLISGKLKEVI